MNDRLSYDECMEKVRESLKTIDEEIRRCKEITKKEEMRARQKLMNKQNDAEGQEIS